MTITLREVEWDHPDSVALRGAQRAELTERYGTSESEPGPAPTADDVAYFVVAYRDEEPVGCGGLRPLDDTHGEIKRMFVTPAHRGSGVSTTVLSRLESEGRARGWTRLVLETGDAQPDAIRFYEREGYTRIPNFGHYADSPLSVCFEKPLAT